MMNDNRSFLGNRYERITDFHNYIIGERDQARASIMREVSGGDCSLVKCLCGNKDDSVTLAAIDRWGIPSNHILCMSCGLLRVSPRWEADTYGRIYARHFWTIQTGQSDISRERFNLSLERSVAFVKAISDYVTDLKGKRVIEIGCSYGAGLERLKKKGAVLVGYDWDEKILSAGRKYTGLDLRQGGIREALNQMERPYDFVILRHVFEHLLDPYAEGELLRDLVCDHGFVFIEVPGVLNADEWSPDPMGFFNVFHVYSYCLRTLTRVMERCGFDLVHGDEHIYSLWRPSSVDNITPWEDQDAAKRILEFIHRMERKRFWRQSFPGRLISLVRNWVFN